MNRSFNHLPLVLAHELAHSLGAGHDNETVQGYLMGPKLPETLTATAEAFSIGTIDSIRTQLMLQMEHDQCGSCLYSSWCFTNENESAASTATANSTGEESGTTTEMAAAIVTAMIVLIVKVIIWKKMWPAPTP